MMVGLIKICKSVFTLELIVFIKLSSILTSFQLKPLFESIAYFKSSHVRHTVARAYLGFGVGKTWIQIQTHHLCALLSCLNSLKLGNGENT